MTRSLCFLALLLGAANAGADAPPDHAARNKAEAGRPASSGYLADVEVSFGGFTRHGRIIVTRDGFVHLEHLDEQARRCVHGLIHRAHHPIRGWDDRTDPVRSVWCRLGRDDALAEIYTADASIKVSRHRLLSAR